MNTCIGKPDAAALVEHTCIADDVADVRVQFSRAGILNSSAEQKVHCITVQGLSCDFVSG